MLRASAGDSGIQVLGMLAGAVVFIIAIIARLFGFGKPDPNKWYGKMTCSKFGYFWESRKATPPARCPRCSTNRIEPLLG
jgi:hypothetical protein